MDDKDDWAKGLIEGAIAALAFALIGLEVIDAITAEEEGE